MHFSEDELKKALQRQDPGEGFTQRVMARVEQARMEEKPAPAAKKKANGAFTPWWKLRPAWIIAVAAVLFLSAGWAGYRYSEYRHGEEMRIARANQQRLQKEAEAARDQAVLALEIARAKLNHVLQQAQFPADRNDRIRRQRL